MKKTVLGILLPLIAAAVYAQQLPDADEDEPIYMPAIEVTAAKETKDTGERIDQEDMKREGARDLREALQYMPGVTFTGGGARNESNFRLRGFGVDSVPIIVDGITMANPYRREGDAARFLTGDLESVTVHKGYSSTLLGANTLGGAVVMTIAKPKKPLELMFDAESNFDGVFSYASSTYVAAAGTKQDRFYARAVYQYRDVDHFRLSNDFVPTENNPQQKGDRLWSDSTDKKLTLIAGLTPNSGLDIWATYVQQDADKGLSPPETKIRGYRIWEWPIWNRKSFSLNGEYESGAFNLKALAYYDKYDNRLIEYYSMRALEFGIHGKPSDYDEYSAGARALGNWAINDWNSLQFAATYKKEDHKGLRGGEEEIRVNEDTWSVGTEYSVTPLSKFTFIAGLGFDTLIPNEYWGKDDEFAQKLGARYYVVKSKTMQLYTWQFGVFYEAAKDHELHLTYARKNHFPNMSQRYSTRFGDVLPNPSLRPEIAKHFEFGYEGTPVNALKLNAAVYYSKMTDKIVNIKLPDPNNPIVAVDYARNLDESSFYGFELGARFQLNETFSGGGAFSWNKYNIDYNQSGEIKVLNYYPEVTTNAFIEIKPVKKISIIPRFEYTSSRYCDTGGINKLDAYYLLNIKAIWDINDYLSLSGVANNILDKLYEIREYFPQAGRSYAVSLTVKY